MKAAKNEAGGVLWDDRMPDTPDPIKGFITRPKGERAVMVLPNVATDSLPFCRFVTRFHDRLVRELPASEPAARGLNPPAVPGDWSRLRTAQGLHGSPAGCPPVSGPTLIEPSTRRRAEEQAANDRLGAAARDAQAYLDRGQKLSPEDKEVLGWIVDELFHDDGPASVRLNRESTMGIPQMTRDPLAKMDAARMWLQNGAAIRDRHLKGQWRELYADGILHCNFNGYRTQADTTKVESGQVVPKQRQVLDWRMRPATMDRTLEGPLRGKLVAARTRSFSAYPTSAGFGLRVLCAAVEHALLMRFEELFIHRSAADLNRKTADMTGFELYDVETHDQAMSTDIRDALIDKFGELFGPIGALLCRLATRAPILVHSDYRGQPGALLYEDPLDPAASTIDYVNPSGWPGTSPLAKLGGVYYGTLCYIRAGIVERTREAVVALLHGRHRRGRMLNGGDNLLLGWMGQGPEMPFSTFLHLANLDKAQSFMGYVCEDSGGRVDWRPNLTSAAVRWWAHDFSVGPPRRVNWANGWFERRIHYAAHPQFEVFARVEAEEFKAVFGVELEPYIASFRRKEDFVGDEGQRDLVALFRENPDVIHYKLRVQDLPREVVEEAFITLTAADVEPLYRALGGRG